jgi:hypothetical protein
MRPGQLRDPHKEQFWRGHLARWQRSGLSIPVYCARHDLAPTNFYAWRGTLARCDRKHPAPTPTSVTFVRITLPTQPLADEAPIEVVLHNGRRLRVAPTVAFCVVRDLVALLEAATC